MSQPLVYGAYGYTGELVARTAIDAGLRPILAGRREPPLRALARDLGTDYRVASVGDLSDVLDDVAVFVGCAGPFVDTCEPAVEACLATGTHYVDVTGEIPAFAAIEAYDDRAREAGVTLLPGAGFDVVPSDCLAARLVDRLPTTTALRLALDGFAAVSPGTARTAARLLGEGSTVRENGTLRDVRFGERTRVIDTGAGPRRMGAVPWGDVFTAFHTTGVSNVAVYAPGVTAQRILGRLQPVFRLEPVCRLTAGLTARLADGPDERTRAEERATIWGAATDGDRTVAGRVHTPEPYRFTARSVVAVVRRLLDNAPAGYQTPAGTYGADLASTVDGTRVESIE